MFVKYLRLEKYAAFMASGITTLEATFTEPLQIILGTNGSGKSRLLERLLGKPASKSEFLENGADMIVIQHRGSVYELQSDFSKKDGAHTFIKDGVNLNDGGTTMVQNDLLNTYLNINKQTIAILMGQHNFAQMPSGMRKTLLVEHNPSNLSFIIEDHKRVLSHIRGMKSNLNMLQERRVALESEMLDPSIIAEFHQGIAQLQKYIADDIADISALKTIRKDMDVTPAPIDSTLQDADHCMKAAVRLQPKFADLPTQENRQEQRAAYVADIQSQDVTDNLLSEQLAATVAELETLRTNLKDATDESAATEARLRIDTYQVRIVELEKYNYDNVLKDSQLDEAKYYVGKVSTLCLRFIDCPVKLRTTRKTQGINNRLHHLDVRFSYLKDQRQRLLTRSNQLRSSQKIRLSDIPEGNCAQMACPLYANFRSVYDAAKAEFVSNQEQLKVIDHHLTRLARYLEQRQAQTERYAPYEQSLSVLQSLMASSSVLQKLFRGLDILKLLQNNPIRLRQIVEDAITLGDHYQEYQNCIIGRDREVRHMASFSSLSEGERARLDIQIETLVEKETSLRARLADCHRTRRGLAEKLSLLDTRIQTETSLIDMQSTLNELLKDHEQAYRAKTLDEVISLLEKNYHENLTELSLLTQKIQHQEQLSARYIEEVMSRIDIIQKEKTEWESLEKALGEIPKLSMISYINAIIGIMNAYISRVFTYPFELKTLEPTDHLDYKFSAENSGVFIPDISTCSRAQCEVINLTFSLALRKIAGLDDYPIYLDEVGSSFDHAHKNRLLDLLTEVIEDHRVSQMFLINHHATVHEGLANNETLVLSDANIVVPTVYNEHVFIEK